MGNRKGKWAWDSCIIKNRKWAGSGLGLGLNVDFGTFSFSDVCNFSLV